jgi:transposase, IS30 family
MKKKKFIHIKKAERLEIAILLKKKYSHRDIAKALGRDHTTVDREIRNNSVKGKYDPRKANHKSYVKRKYSKYQGMKIIQEPDLLKYIERKLRQGWSPDVIAGRLKKHDTYLPYVSSKTIYKFLYSSRGQYLCRYLASKRYNRKRRGKKKAKKEMIPNRVGIEMRPDKANNREELGHLEEDLIVSGKRHKSKAALSVSIDRLSRQTKLQKMLSQKPAEHNQVLEKVWSEFPNLKTVTLDNGIENTKHEELSAGLSIDIFFCNPYSSWEKGGVENLNGLIRRWIPKGCDIDDYSAEEIQWIENRLNNTPRKSLSYLTPNEVTIKEIDKNLPLTFNQKQHRSGAVEG